MLDRHAYSATPAYKLHSTQIHFMCHWSDCLLDSKLARSHVIVAWESGAVNSKQSIQIQTQTAATAYTTYNFHRISEGIRMLLICWIPSINSCSDFVYLSSRCMHVYTNRHVAIRYKRKIVAVAIVLSISMFIGCKRAFISTYNFHFNWNTVDNGGSTIVRWTYIQIGTQMSWLKFAIFENVSAAMLTIQWAYKSTLLWQQFNRWWKLIGYGKSSTHYVNEQTYNWFIGHLYTYTYTQFVIVIRYYLNIFDWKSVNIWMRSKSMNQLLIFVFLTHWVTWADIETYIDWTNDGNFHADDRMPL